MQKPSVNKLSSLPIILVLISYYLVMMVPARGSQAVHVLNHGTEEEANDDDRKLEPLRETSIEYRNIASQELETELPAGYNKSSSLWLQQQWRRRLTPFELCLACKCCISATDPTTCTSMPCCFVIDCQLPNKPFGVCGFVPKTCNCTSCPAPV